MSKFKKFFTKLGLSQRDRYLYDAADLADLEFRQKSWDKAMLDQSNYYRTFTF
jgi:hypothetical protein